MFSLPGTYTYTLLYVPIVISHGPSYRKDPKRSIQPTFTAALNLLWTGLYAGVTISRHQLALQAGKAMIGGIVPLTGRLTVGFKGQGVYFAVGSTSTQYSSTATYRKKTHE